MPNFDIFLKLDGIPGDSTVRGHEDEIVVLSYDQGVEISVHQSGGGGASSAGRPTFSVVRFRKNADVASIPLLLACASGRHIREGVFTFRHGAEGFELYEVTLEDLLVTRVAQRAGAGFQYPLTFEALNSGVASDGFLDEVSLNYARIRWEHRSQRPDGSTGATTSGGWDAHANHSL